MKRSQNAIGRTFGNLIKLDDAKRQVVFSKQEVVFKESKIKDLSEEKRLLDAEKTKAKKELDSIIKLSEKTIARHGKKMEVLNETLIAKETQIKRQIDEFKSIKGRSNNLKNNINKFLSNLTTGSKEDIESNKESINVVKSIFYNAIDQGIITPLELDGQLRKNKMAGTADSIKRDLSGLTEKDKLTMNILSNNSRMANIASISGFLLITGSSILARVFSNYISPRSTVNINNDKKNSPTDRKLHQIDSIQNKLDDLETSLNRKKQSRSVSRYRRPVRNNKKDKINIFNIIKKY